MTAALQRFLPSGAQPAHQTLAEAWPDVDPGIRPFGTRVIVQIRTAMRKTKGGVILTDDARDTEKWNLQTAKVRSVGPVAFRNRTTLAPWPEDAWCKSGDFVRCPKYGGDRWEVPFGPGDDVALFAIFEDKDLVGAITGDPLSIRAFI